MPIKLHRLLNMFGRRKVSHKRFTAAPKQNLVWFQHFHKAGGTSIIEAARSAGYRFFEPNINGNPMESLKTPIPLWDLDKKELSEWLTHQGEKGVNFICAEFGFSHAVFDITTPSLKRIASIRRPKDRLISNFIYDVAEGYTRATTILDYMQPDKTHTMPDYYTRLITKDTGEQARLGAIAAIKRFDYVSVLEVPETFSILRSHLPGLTSRHSNRTNYEDDAVREAWQTVQSCDEQLNTLCMDETKLYNAVRTHFASRK